MKLTTEFIKPLEKTISFLLASGRVIAIISMGLMVIIMLVQVFFRYVLNNSLAWPDEAARFCMLWMTGLMAPSAYRWGNFVAINLVKDVIGRRLGALLSLAILLLGLVVLIVAVQQAQRHIDSGWLFNSSSLKIPLQLIGGESVRVKLAWMYLSLPVGFALMILVSIELIFKNCHEVVDSSINYPPDPDRISAVAE